MTEKHRASSVGDGADKSAFCDAGASDSIHSGNRGQCVCVGGARSPVRASDFPALRSTTRTGDALVPCFLASERREGTSEGLGAEGGKK